MTIPLNRETHIAYVRLDNEWSATFTNPNSRIVNVDVASDVGPENLTLLRVVFESDAYGYLNELDYSKYVTLDRYEIIAGEYANLEQVQGARCIFLDPDTGIRAWALGPHPALLRNNPGGPGFAQVPVSDMF